MNLEMDKSMAFGYKSPSQITKKITEQWMLECGYCPSCQSSLLQSKANSKVHDFSCLTCTNEFELKSKKGSLGRKVTDGAYTSMINRIAEDNSPHFFFLSYDQSYTIKNLIAVPNYFFQNTAIEKRKPLPIKAKRAGWIGCNILLDQIPDIGKISLIENSRIIEPDKVQKVWQKTTFLGLQNTIESRGWTLDVMKCIELLGLKSFNLQQLYQYEPYLSERHPDNNHVKDKIRQQLQILRDKGILEFTSRGKYGLTDS